MGKKKNKPIDEDVATFLLTSDTQSDFQKALYRQLGEEECKILGFDKEWIKGAWLIRDEIVEDIGPLFGAKREATVEKPLRALIKKINDLLKPSWELSPGEKSLWGGFENNPVYGRLGPTQGILKIGKSKWFVTMDFDTDSPKHYLYGGIISALQTGRFSDLKRCQWEKCQKFFIGRGNKYCGRKCMNKSNAPSGPSRAKKSREESREKVMEIELSQDEENTPFIRFYTFMELVRKKAKELTRPERLRRKQYLRAIGKGEAPKGWEYARDWKRQLRLRRRQSSNPLKKIWEGLSDPVKKVFEKSFREMILG